MNSDKLASTIFWFYVIAALASLSLSIGTVIVAMHFILKFW